MAGANAFIKRLERFASNEIKERMAQKVRVALHNECLRCFKEQRDPYGVPWAPRKRPPDWAIRAFGLMQDNHLLLDKTGAGISSITSRVSGATIRLAILGRMKFHQSGTSKMVARKFFPVEGRGLGMWQPAVNDAALEAVRDMIRNG